MYLGSYKTEFSGKNRLILPRRFRRELGNEDKFYVFLGKNGEVWGFDQENWLKQAESVLNIPLSTDEGRLKRLSFFSRAEECSLDGQGRFILPQEFIEQVRFGKQVLIVGAGDHFEIWDPQVWKEELHSIEQIKN